MTTRQQQINNPKQKRRSRKSKRTQAILLNLKQTFPTKLTLVLALTIWCWFGTLAYSHHKLTLLDEESFLDVHVGLSQYLRSSKKRRDDDDNDNNHQIPIVASDNNHDDEALDGPRFLIYEADRLVGQGAGNLLNGLLAVHLLGEEFGRTVCIIPDYSFHLAFELIDPIHQQLCDQFFQDHPSEKPSNYGLGRKERINMVNYREPPDECHLKQKLESNSTRHKFIYAQANTYPRWRSVPPNFFFQYYRAKQELLDMLPYNPKFPPTTVVHLRKEDGPGDKRKGLDEVSLEALGNLLMASPSPEQDLTSSNNRDAITSTTVNKNISGTPYLVTNHVAWYDYFEQSFGWNHPNWDSVGHSALRKDWGNRDQTTPHEFEDLESSDTKKIQDMQLWADWYTILTAQRVYHTYSDFSMSAIHWMGSDPHHNNDSVVWSRIILGITVKVKDKTTGKVTGKLELTEENWVLDEDMPRMVDRVGSDLHNCNKGPQLLRRLVDPLDF